MRQNRRNGTESGNVFLMVLIGIVLFAALMFTLSRGFSDAPGSMSSKQAKLDASDILDYAARVERAVSRLRGRSVSENDISFEHGGSFVNAGCSADSCKVFASAGGGVNWQEPPQNVSASSWHFTGKTCIVNVGAGGMGCDSDGNDNEELLLVLPSIDQSVCEEINSRLGISGIPANAGSGYSTDAFDGSFDDGTLPDNMDGKSAGCFDGGGGQPGYHFYQVLIAR